MYCNYHHFTSVQIIQRCVMCARPQVLETASQSGSSLRGNLDIMEAETHWQWPVRLSLCPRDDVVNHAWTGGKRVIADICQ